MTQTRGLPEWAKNLKKYRKLEGLTQADLGAKFSVTAQAVSYWEHGVSEPPVAVLAWMMTVAARTPEGQAHLLGGGGHLEMNGQTHSEAFSHE